MTRAAAVIVEAGRVALIERKWQGEAPYYLFPGGHVEAGETLEQAVVREIREELGLDVEVGQLVAQVTYNGNDQHYFRATVTGGSFGSGTGPEAIDSTFMPVWLPIADLGALPVYPRPLALLVEASATGWPAEPLRFVDSGRSRVA